MRTISPDSYIRLSLAELGTLAFVHLVSGLDEDRPACTGESAAPTAITGYTEWLSTDTPALSIGWDWVMDVADGVMRLNRHGEPRSNCMLVDAEGRDLGHSASIAALAGFVDTMRWQADAAAQIAMRYGPKL